MARQTTHKIDETEWGNKNTFGVSIASQLELGAISASFDGKQILHDISLEAKPGEVISLLGPSGSGKTTLLRIMAGLETPSSGKVLIDDKIVVDANTFVEPEKRGIGLVFQDYALFPHLNILQNVAFGLNRLGAKDRREQAMIMLERVGMDHLATAHPHTLSGGEQQRVALARALAPRPGILLMDEPFSGLDARLRDNVREKTIELLRDTRATVILVTHDPEEALRVSDRIVLMRSGHVEQTGSCDDLYYRPASLFSAGFFSELNRFRAICESGKLATPMGNLETSQLGEGQEADICVRQSDLIVTTAAAPSNGGDLSSACLGKITKRRFMGMVELVDIYVPGHDITMKARMKSGLLASDALAVSVCARLENFMVFPR